MPNALKADLFQQRGRKAWLTVVRAYLTCNQVLTAKLAAEGIRMAEHEVLINLSESPGMTQQELAAHSFSAKSGMSMLISQMEQRGLVERSAHDADARAKRVRLTKAGQALAAEALRIQSDVVAVMAQGLSDDDLAKTESLMQHVTQRLQG